MKVGDAGARRTSLHLYSRTNSLKPAPVHVTQYASPRYRTSPAQLLVSRQQRTGDMQIIPRQIGLKGHKKCSPKTILSQTNFWHHLSQTGHHSLVRTQTHQWTHSQSCFHQAFPVSEEKNYSTNMVVNAATIVQVYPALGRSNKRKYLWRKTLKSPFCNKYTKLDTYIYKTLTLT